MTPRSGRLQKRNAFLIDSGAGVSDRCAAVLAVPRQDCASTGPVVGPLLRRRGLEAERALRVAVGTVRPGQRALARQLLSAALPESISFSASRASGTTRWRTTRTARLWQSASLQLARCGM